jgi:hypothetical protein
VVKSLIQDVQCARHIKKFKEQQSKTWGIFAETPQKQSKNWINCVPPGTRMNLESPPPVAILRGEQGKEVRARLSSL